MRLHFEVKTELKALHKKSGMWITFDECEAKDLDENSKEFKEVLELYESATNTKRPATNTNDYDEKMLKFLVDNLADDVRASKESLFTTAEGAFQGKFMNATLNFGNYLINVFDFSAFRFGEIETRIYKK